MFLSLREILDLDSIKNSPVIIIRYVASQGVAEQSDARGMSSMHLLIQTLSQTLKKT
jgi:hypothetical protein